MKKILFIVGIAVSVGLAFHIQSADTTTYSPSPVTSVRVSSGTITSLTGVDTITNLTTVGTVTGVATVTNVTTVGTITGINTLTNIASAILTPTALLKSVTGDTNVPVQLTASSIAARAVTFIGMSNRVANVGTVYIQYGNTANTIAYPLAASGVVQWTIPPHTTLNLSNFWIQAVETNDGVGVLYLE